VHTASLHEYDPKLLEGSPKFSIFNKVAQKFGSPSQKLDLTKSLKSSYDRSRREKSESISTLSLYTRTNTTHNNNSQTNRNASLKTRNDSLNEKNSTLNTSKNDKTSSQASRPKTQGQQQSKL